MDSEVHKTNNLSVNSSQMILLISSDQESYNSQRNYKAAELLKGKQIEFHAALREIVISVSPAISLSMIYCLDMV